MFEPNFTRISYLKVKKIVVFTFSEFDVKFGLEKTSIFILMFENFSQCIRTLFC